MPVHSNRQNTAILLFVRSAREESEIKRFSYARGFQNNLKLIRLLNQRLQKAAHQTGLPTFIIPGAIQKGQTFGERLANAFQQVFDSGFEKVIAVGNDCLQVDTRLLSLAKKKMETSDLLLGPDQRGGTYLVGVSQKAFDKTLFEGLDWQTSSLLKAFEAYSELLQSDLQLLPFRKDINNPEELKDAISELPRLLWIRRALNSILKQPSSISITTLHRFNPVLFYFDTHLRAPPNLPF